MFGNNADPGGCAWADILLCYAGFIVKYFVIPAVIGGIIGWMIGRWR